MEAQVEMQGTVAYFNVCKGYGFIAVPNLKKDVYVEYKDLEGEVPITRHRYTGRLVRVLRFGQTVEFDTVRETKGLRAINVRVVK